MKRLLAAILLTIGGQGQVVAAETGIGLRASTLGVGAELSVGLLERLVLRIPFNTFRYSSDITEEGITYDGELSLRSVGLLADVHPFGGTFHVTGGAYSNGNELALLANEQSGNATFPVGNREYRSAPDDPFALSARLDFDSVAPYAGIGWGNAAQAQDRGVYFKLELGVLFQGSPRAEAKGRGSVCEADSNDCSGDAFNVEDDDPRAEAFRDELERERRSLESSLSEFRFYPVAGFSLGMRF